MPIKNITVIGGGTMGNGIAQVFAMFEYNVTLCDISQIALSKAMNTIQTNLERMTKKGLIAESEVSKSLNRIQTTVSLDESVKFADLVIEAASENIDVKKEIFRIIDKKAPNHCVLATNTSSISITQIAAVTLRPEKVIGMHFMNPVPVMKLVEVIRGYATKNEVCNDIMLLASAVDKIPVEVQDYPGFVANRILMPMINESIFTLFEGIAGVDEIDKVMKLGMAHPMGPLALADFIGLDVCLSILNVMNDGFGNPKYAPCPLLVNMVAAGKLGKKTGEGFYKYTEGTKDLVISQKFSKH